MLTVAPPTAGLRRGWQLFGLATALTTSSIRARWQIQRGADPVQTRQQASRRNAETMRKSVGNLKGGVQKAGQLVSTLEALLPSEPWQEALADLRESGSALAYREIAEVLSEELGAGWLGYFSSFDTVPVAAASLGQVHRAQLRTGQEVAVKVQYPQVAAALAADVRVLGWLLQVVGWLSPGMAAAPVSSELSKRLTGELDYETEARVQTEFRQGFADVTDVFVPQVLHATPMVLITEWCPGVSLTEVIKSATNEERNHIGATLIEFQLSAPARAGYLHADPHPGNFRLLPDGRLGVLDFGAVVPMPGGLPTSFASLIAAMRTDDPVLAQKQLERAGLIRAGAQLDIAALMDFMGPFSEPARFDRFQFSRRWLSQQFDREHDPRTPDYTVAMSLTLPPEQLMTHRVWLGLVGVLSALAAEVDLATPLHTWLPGLTSAGTSAQSVATTPHTDTRTGPQGDS